jgi:hypothetical protein
MGHGPRRRLRLLPPRRIPLLHPELRPHVHRRHLDPLVLRDPAQERRLGCRQLPRFPGRRHPGREDIHVQPELKGHRGSGKGRDAGFEAYGAEGGGKGGEGYEISKEGRTLGGRLWMSLHTCD